jgi:hypothetical protein
VFRTYIECLAIAETVDIRKNSGGTETRNTRSETEIVLGSAKQRSLRERKHVTNLYSPIVQKNLVVFVQQRKHGAAITNNQWSKSSQRNNQILPHRLTVALVCTNYL